MFDNEYAQKQAYAAQAQNTAYAGQVTSGSNQAVPMRATSDDLFQSIGNQLVEIGLLKDRVSRVADRISGAIPRDVSKEAGMTAPHTLIAKLEIIQTVLRNYESELSESLNRIEKVI